MLSTFRNPLASVQNSAVSIRLPKKIYVSSSVIEAELELNFRQLYEENIHEVRVELRGIAKTVIGHDDNRLSATVHLVQDCITPWVHGTMYPPASQDVLRIPFRITLPPNLPPNFEYHDLAKEAYVRYTLVTVCVRSPSAGVLQRDRRIYVPLAIAQRNDMGIVIKDKLGAISAGRLDAWRTHRVEEKIRKGFWGDYATVRVNLTLPDLNEFPLFVPIPFVICIETTSPPLSRSKAGAHPQDKPVFPAVPTSYRLLEFTLRRHISIRSRGDSWHDSSETIAYIGAAARAAVKQSIPERVWVPLGHGRDGASEDPSPDPMGTWVQRATFWSTFRLDCSHSFSVHNITCTHSLDLKVPFPGIGNDVNIHLPLAITSGLDEPILKNRVRIGEDPKNAARDVPPAYIAPTGVASFWDDETA
ncbi:hypothetical protein ONZ51_g4996 [Trametes cubensis]|uniref:Arrestin-like N-terminal domain-containing protein n=1 Tax=Trametes cubensis TaxID=1111947 RepID=A0AAD7TX90_9APHY|nr:hypothetical protein ONZ51_g4996 [Trametes cubensis]